MEQTIRDILTAGGMDVDVTVARFGGNEGLFLKFLRRFPSDPSYTQLTEAMQSGQREIAKIACHTLKGVSANLGLTRLFEACNAMVTELRATDDSDVSGLYVKISDEYRNTLEMIRLIC